MAVDSQGNVHIAYCDWFGGYWGYEIFYTMLDSNGNTLIDDTMVSEDDGMPSRRPAIIVDSEDKVHIVWQQRDYDYDTEPWIRMELYYTKLDPSLDNQDGDSADESAITEVDDTPLTDFGWYYWGDEECEDVWPSVGPPRIDIDSGDNIHIVFPAVDWCYYYFQGVYYMQIDSEGNINVDVIKLRHCEPWRANPDVAVDSNDNPHITWNDDEDTSGDETYYMMLNGGDGTTLIDATLITPNDGESSKGQSILVDGEDKVHIIWKDQLGDGQAVYYTKLDPSLDTQDGDAADPSVITLIDDKAVSTDAAGYRVKRIGSAIACGRYIHLSWWEQNTEDLYYMVLDTDGNPVVTERALTTTGSVTTSRGGSMAAAWMVPYLDVDSNGKAHITWCDDRGSPGNYTEVYYTSYDGPPCEAPPSAPVGVPALTQWGAIGMIIALAGCIVWTLRKRKVSLNAP